ncbi:MAG: hypothetical protein ACTSX6_01705, partial [Candidatus Heimdallarchaeaceae archaeon]
MKKRIFLGIGLLLILLPLVSPNATTAMTSNPPIPDKPTFDSLTAGTKLYYNISTFEYGQGIWDVLDLLLSEVGGPSFDKGLVGSLEGSELQVFITAMKDLPLYQYDYNAQEYENETIQTAMQAFAFLKLNDNIKAYANASMFSFPEDFIDQNYTYYFEYWPYGDFIDPIGDYFWSNFNSSFVSEFERAWMDANNSWGFNPNQWDWPHEDWYSKEDLGGFAYDLGQHLGYMTGWNVWETNPGDNSWYDGLAALDGAFASFFDGRSDGFLQGQTDYTTNKIPDKFAPALPSPVTVYDFSYNEQYNRFYGMYYQSGFLYEGSLDYFNDKLYWNLYDNAWDTFYSGYVQGYENYYWDGYWDGDTDSGTSYPGANYWPPEFWSDPWDDHEAGYQSGALDGYEQGYYDGFYSVNIGQDYLNGMYGYNYLSYYDGFAEGAADLLASQPKYPEPTLPYSPATNPYEEGANFIYENLYNEGYDRGYLYATLVSSPDPLYWLISNGPFYNMTLPDAEFNILSGSIIPTPMMGMTLFTNLSFALNAYDYEFDWGSFDYWPFSSNFLPGQTFNAIDTDWVDLDSLDTPLNSTSGDPGLNTTYDVVNNNFLLEMHVNDSNSGILADIYWLYNTTDGMLLNISASVDFYQMTDMWLDIVLELEYPKIEVLSPTLPSPTSWTYTVNDFIFYYDVPPSAPTDFVQGLQDFKMNATSTIGHNLLGVTMKSYEGLWAKA